MTRPSAEAPARARPGMAGAFALGALLIAPTMALATPAAVGQFYERSLMSEAGRRCNLFSADISGALGASTAQAHGAALRAGVSPEDLSAVQRRAAAKAEAAGCASADIAAAAGKVRSAFQGYAHIETINYPGEIADWHAERSVSQLTQRWRLYQASAFGPDRMIFGQVGADASLSAVVSFADGKSPYAARLLLRDPSRAPQPYLDQRAADRSGKLPLPARMPPRVSSEVFAAESKDVPAKTLLPEAAKVGVRFRFPPAAAAALADLDPREAVAVEFVFAGARGDEVRRAYVEVGDFAAGRAFLYYVGGEAAR